MGTLEPLPRLRAFSGSLLSLLTLFFPPASFHLPDPQFLTVNCGACDLSASPTTGRANQCPGDPDLTASVTVQCCGFPQLNWVSTVVSMVKILISLVESIPISLFTLETVFLL